QPPGGFGAIADLGSEREDVEFQRVEALPRRLLDAPHLGVDHLTGARDPLSKLLSVGDLLGGDPDNVGVTGGNPQHTGTAATDQERGTTLARLGEAVVVDLIVLTLEPNRL